jgi:hypothetical protein
VKLARKQGVSVGHANQTFRALRLGRKSGQISFERGENCRADIAKIHSRTAIPEIRLVSCGWCTQQFYGDTSSYFIGLAVATLIRKNG